MTVSGFTRRGVLLGSAAALAMSNNANAATLAEIKKRGYMSVATEDDFRPFEFTKDGKPTGYDQELLEAFRKKAGFEVRQDIIPWTGILPGVSTGKYDAAMTAVLVTQERMKTLGLLQPGRRVGRLLSQAQGRQAHSGHQGFQRPARSASKPAAPC